MYIYNYYLKFKTIYLEFKLSVKEQFKVICSYYLFRILVNFYRITNQEDKPFFNKLNKLTATLFFFNQFEYLYGSFFLNTYYLNLLEWRPYNPKWINKNKLTYVKSLSFYKNYEQMLKKLDTSYTEGTCLFLNLFFNKKNKYFNYIYLSIEFYFIILNLCILFDAILFRFTKDNFHILSIFLFKGPKNFRNRGGSQYFNSDNFNYLFLDHYAIHNYLYLWSLKKLTITNIFTFRLFYQTITEVLIQSASLYIYIYKFFKNWLIATLVSILFLYFAFFFFNLSFLKIISGWVAFGLFVFWLLSTFNFFVKRYRFGKYTSAIQRFWKRAFMCFWLIEGFLFSILFFYLLNASGEPLFMFDTYGLYINHLLSIKPFLINSFLVVLILNIFIYIIINIKVTTLKKNIFILLTLTLMLLYILFIESYQFYYLLNYYIEYLWIYSEEDGIWELDFEAPRTRNKNHYVTLVIVAKFWHYIFIFASWVFFIMKTLELNRIRYSFLSMNYQNLILFYIMNWLCLYSWMKWITRRFIDQTYYWFFTSFRPLSVTSAINDLIHYIQNLITHNFFLFKNIFNFNFFYCYSGLLLPNTQNYVFKLFISKDLLF